MYAYFCCIFTANNQIKAISGPAIPPSLSKASDLVCSTSLMWLYGSLIRPGLCPAKLKGTYMWLNTLPQADLTIININISGLLLPRNFVPNSTWQTKEMWHMLNIRKHFLTVKPARNVVLGSGGTDQDAAFWVCVVFIIGRFESRLDIIHQKCLKS